MIALLDILLLALQVSRMAFNLAVIVPASIEAFFLFFLLQ